MDTIRIYLGTSGRIVDLKKDFPLYQNSFQNKLLNIYVPTSIIAPSIFTEQVQEYPLLGGAEGATIPVKYWANSTEYGTTVKIGMSYTDRSGQIKVSKAYFLNYLKNLVFDGVEYALFERMLPQEFTVYAGQGANSPIMNINVLVINTGTNKVLREVTTQQCALEVMPSQSVDTEEQVAASDLDTIFAQLGSLTQTDNEQNEEISKLKAQDIAFAERISTNEKNISINAQEIANIEENFSTGETYIGRISGSTLPTDGQLSYFVHTQAGRNPQAGDVVIFVQIMAGTDKNYKYIYSKVTNAWSGYEIPPMELAGNGTYGIVQGTYGIGKDYSTLVDIVGGEIKDIYIKNSDTSYLSVRQWLLTHENTLDNIISGDVSVGRALRAVADALGNNIVDTYLTKNAGATKQYVQDYALPRVFNDTAYLSADGYVGTVPTTPASGVQFSVATNSVGDHTLFMTKKTLDSTFELSRKNSASTEVWVTANRNCVVTFRLTTEAVQGGVHTPLAVELSNSIALVANTPQKVSFNALFESLQNTVLAMNIGDSIMQELEVFTTESTPTTFSVYSNSIYPSTLGLNVNTQRIVVQTGLIGELPEYSAVGTLDGNVLTFALPTGTEPTDNIFGKFVLSYPTDTEPADTTEIQLSYGQQIIRLVTPYNRQNGNATLSMLKQTNVAWNATDGLKIGFTGLVQRTDTDEISVEVNEDNLADYATREDVSIAITNTALTGADFAAALTAGKLANGTVAIITSDYTGGGKSYITGHSYKVVGTLQGGVQTFEAVDISPFNLLDSNSATSGQVLTANGAGGASWQDASSGGGIVPVDILPTATEEEYDKHLLYLQEQSLKYIARKTTDGSISSVNTMPKAKSRIRPAAVGSKVYLFSGNTSQNEILVYDIVSNTIETLETVLPVMLYDCSVSAVGTDIYILGGQDYSANVSVNTIYKFDTLTNSISKLTSTLPLNMEASTCVSNNTDIYLFGGRTRSSSSHNNYSNTIIKFDTLANTSTILSTKLPKQLGYLSSAIVGDTVYLFGGSNSDGAYYNIYKYNISTGIISTLSATLEYGADCVASIGTDIYMFGGSTKTNFNPINEIRKFSTTNETISTLSLTLPNPTKSIGSSSVGTDIFLFGGQIPYGYTTEAINTINKFSIGFEYLFKTISAT